MQLSDSFVSFQQDIGTCDFFPELEMPPALLELNIDPQGAILEFRRFLGDPNGTCFRMDCCLSVGRNEHGELVIWATERDLEDLAYWPIASDWQARQRAQKVALPFAETSLLKVDAVADGDAALLNLVLAHASAKDLGTRLLKIRLGVDFCEVIR